MTIATNIGTLTRSLPLSRKGRRVFQACTGLAVIILTVLILGAVSFPQSPSSAVASDQADARVYEQIVVQPGDTLWGISTRLSQDDNQAAILEQILAYNNLESSELQVGQLLYIPVRD